MELELRHMELVCRIHEAGSLSKAARQLGVSQPSLTAALHRIERAAGGRLFDRSQHGIAPTDLGQFLLSRARPLVNEVKALTLAVRQRAERGERRTLRLVITPGPYLGRLLTLLEARFADRELSAQVDFGVNAHLQKLATGRLEAAVVAYAPDMELGLSRDLQIRHLVEAEPVWVALGERHALAGNEIIELSALSDQDWIAPPGGDSDGTTAQFESACRDAGFVPRIRYRLDDMSAVTQVLANTQAIILAQPTARRNPGVVVRPLAGDPMAFRVSLIWRATALSDHDSGDLFQALVDSYAEVIGNNEPYPLWWERNAWAHTDPAWAQAGFQAGFQATSSS